MLIDGPTILLEMVALVNGDAAMPQNCRNPPPVLSKVIVLSPMVRFVVAPLEMVIP